VSRNHITSEEWREGLAFALALIVFLGSIQALHLVTLQ
jgi:hypothetical protein